MFFRRRARRRLPDDPVSLLGRHLGEWVLLDAPSRERLLGDIETLLATKSWEAARGFELTDEMCTVIAAQGALLVNGLDVELLRHVRAIVVHPSTVVIRGPHAGPAAGLVDDSPMYLDGEAHDHQGPVLLSWNVVRRETSRPGTGRNVVIHELAHKLDMLDGAIDGTPPIADGDRRARFAAASVAVYDELRADPGRPGAVLRDYAASDPGEFFAVASEAFFDRPCALGEAHTELYGALRDYYCQDPGERRRRAGLGDDLATL